MRTRGRGLVAAVVVGAAIFAGCSAENDTSEPEATPSSSTTSSFPATPTDDPSSSEPTSEGNDTLQGADAKPLPPAAMELIEKLPAVQDDQGVRVVGVDSAGTLFLARAPVTDSVELTEADLVLRTADGKEVPLKPATASGQPAQVIGAALDDRHAVWMETPSVDGMVQPWTLYDYDREAGTVSELTSSPPVGGGPPPAVPGYTGPVLEGDRVFWAQVDGKPRSLEVDIWGCQVTACDPQIVIPGAAFPAVADGQVYAIAAARFTGEKTSSEMTIESTPAAGGEVEVVKTIELAPTQVPNGLAASDAGLVWLTQDSAGADLASVWYAGTEELLTVESASAGVFSFPVATDHFLAWAEASGTADVANLLVDREGGLHSLGGTGSLYGIAGSGDIAIWRDTKSGGGVDPSDVEYLVARLTLP